MIIIEDRIERNEISKNNIKNKLYILSRDFPFDMPFEIRKEILKWRVVSKSPYSYSYYNITNKTWDDSFDDKFLRVSDHWNFFTRDKIHCETTDKKDYKGDWSIGEFQPKIKKYKIIKSLKKDNNSVSKCIDKLDDVQLKKNILMLEKDEDFVFAMKKVNLGKMKMTKSIITSIFYYRQFFYYDEKNILHIKDRVKNLLTILK